MNEPAARIRIDSSQADLRCATRLTCTCRRETDALCIIHRSTILSMYE